MNIDALTDSDRESMRRAAIPFIRPECIDAAIDAIWAARPSAARALDEAALNWQSRKTYAPDALVLAALQRGRDISQ